MEDVSIKPLENEDKEWVKKLLKKQWGSAEIVTKGKILNAVNLPGFKAISNGNNVGLITYYIESGECEIVTVDSLEKSRGIGSKLIEEVIKTAESNKCTRICVITTNDNMNALKFYQKRGFFLAALYPNALVKSRKLKPEIPETGIDGLPLRDEIELEMKFS